MITQARIDKSKARFQRLSDKRGLVSQITATKKLNSGRKLEPLRVTEFFEEGQKAMSAALSEAAQEFGKKKVK